MTQLPNTASIEEIIAQLQAVTGLNSRTELAQLIGGTATDTEGMDSLISKLTTEKQNVITNLKTMNPALNLPDGSALSAIPTAVATMPNKGAVTITPGATAQTIPSGYHNGSGTVAAVVVPAANVLTGTTIAGTAGTMPISASGARPIPPDIVVTTPGELFVKIPPSTYYEDNVYLRMIDGDWIAANFRADKNVFGLQGSIQIRTGFTPATGTQISGTTLRLRGPGGYYDGASDFVTYDDPDFIAANILSTANIFGLQGTAVAGKRTASGQATVDGIGQLTVTGLTFLPRIILAWDAASADGGTSMRYWDRMSTTQYYRGVSTNAISNNGGYLNNTGFSFYMNTANNGKSHYWEAFE